MVARPAPRQWSGPRPVSPRGLFHLALSDQEKNKRRVELAASDDKQAHAAKIKVARAIQPPGRGGRDGPGDESGDVISAVQNHGILNGIILKGLRLAVIKHEVSQSKEWHEDWRQNPHGFKMVLFYAGLVWRRLGHRGRK